MSAADALLVFRLPYFLSIVFGTMPVQMTIGSADVKPTQKRTTGNVRSKFVVGTLIWITFVSVFLINDVKTMMGLSPTTFFSSKVIEEFPNDYHCIRLLHNAEIWIILLTTLLVSSKTLPVMIEDLQRYGTTQPSSEFSKCRIRLDKKHQMLVFFYLAITVCPVIYDLFLLYNQTSALDFQQILQATLHCVPLTINLQFCSLCMILAYEFDRLNELVSEYRSFLPDRVRKVDRSYGVVCDLVRQLNKTYEIQLLLETGIVTLNLLLFTFHALNAEDHRLPGYADAVYSFIWIGHFAGRLFTTCILASGTVKQARETSRVTLLLEDGYRQISNGHEEILSLVTRVNNQEINFSICGFFVLDGSLVISVCSWCISFILILLQFRTPV